jgi:large subunit ribosomal protein L22
MEAKAIQKHIGTSPTKMRLVIDLIRGRGVEDALNILHFTPKHAARTAEKVLRSAISNYQNKDEAGRVDTATLFVKEAFVNGGPVVKRISPAPMGRAYRIRKRSNHVTIVIAQRAQAVVAPLREKVKAEKAEKSETKAPAAETAVEKKKTAARGERKKKVSTKR